MAAQKGNKQAQKHSKDHVLAVLEDSAKGMQDYMTTKKRVTTKNLTTDSNDYVGYSSIERAMVANGHYSKKINEWAVTWKDDEDVSNAIKRISAISDDMLIINTTEGNMPTAFGIFLCKARLGMVEKGVELQAKSEKPVIQLEIVDPRK